MCGIVGYIGKRQAYPILIKGLHRLEYRGYDSAGVALINSKNELHVYKTKGKVAQLESFAQQKDTSGVVGIAHTRWATHGVPNEQNAHPHLSESGNITLVHNGIIENYATLRAQLQKKGFHFQSQTDTEVLVQLIEYQQQKYACSLADAVRAALKLAIGAYAIAVVDARQPNTIVAARKASPLAIGISDDNTEFFLASDASPIAEYTKHIVYLEDDEVAEIGCGSPLRVTNLKGESQDAKIKEVDMDLSMLDQEGFPQFMLKEIHSQPQVLRDCMRGRIVQHVYTSGEAKADNHALEVVLSAVKENRRQLLRARRIVIVSCGTSWHAGLIGKQLIEHFCRIPVEVAYASEFRYSEPVIEADDVVIAISQSGETADTLAAIQQARQQGAFVYGICNAVGSSIPRNTDAGTYIHVGPEIGVASTKAFTGQVLVLTLFALALGHYKGTVEAQEYPELLEELTRIPGTIEGVLQHSDKIKQIAEKYVESRNFLYLGRGYNYPVALEGALKLKEISYIHAEGYPAAEMKHGPIALIDENMPVVFLTNNHRLYQKVISNLQEVVSRHGQVIAICHEGDEQIKQMATDYIEVPDTLSCLTPLISVIPLQLLGYYVAVSKGLNVDQPRNLAKSVTVE